MSELAKRVHFKGEVERRDEGDRLLEAPGDVVLVNRGIPRALLMKCPDGCGDNLAINLDRRTARAWRLYDRANHLTLFPSVWRDGGCGAHFIVWNDRILWCGYRGVEDNSPDYDSGLEAMVLSALSETPQTDWELADQIDEIPYDVDRVLRKLAKSGRARAVGTRPTKYVVPNAVSERARGASPIHETPAPQKSSWWRRLWRS